MKVLYNQDINTGTYNNTIIINIYIYIYINANVTFIYVKVLT